MERAGGGGGGARLPASYSWSLDVCVCVWCAAVQGVFCNDGNRQSLGHQECGGSQRAAAHWRPRLWRIKEAGVKKKRKILLLSSAPARAIFPLSCVLLRFMPAPAAFYSNGILNVFSLKKQSTMCGVCKSIAECTGGRDKSLSKEPRREGGGGRGTETTTTAATTASATQHGRDRVEEVEGKRRLVRRVCVGAFIPPQRLAQQKYTRKRMIGKKMQESFFF